MIIKITKIYNTYFIRSLTFGVLPAFCLILHMAFMDTNFRKDGRHCLYEY